MAFGFGNAGKPTSTGHTSQSQTGSDLLDIQTEALGFLAIAGESKLQLLPSPWPNDYLPHPSSSLMSIAAKRGLVAAAGPDCVVLATTESIRNAYEGPRIGDSHIRPFQAQLTLPMTMRLSQVIFTADESYLVLSAEVGGGLAVYEVQNLMNGSKNSTFEMSTNSVPLRAAIPNPTPEKGELLAITTMDGKLMIANLKEREFISSATGQILKEGVSCISWSAKGKQLVAGLVDGSAFQMTPEGVAKAQIPRPPAIEPGYHVSSIIWLENDVFMMVHNPSNIDSNQAPTSIFHLVTRLPKSSEHIYQKMADPAPNYGLNRSPPHHFLLRLRDFPPNLRDLIIVSSTASTDIGLFTRSQVPLVSDKPADMITGVFTMTEMSDDSRRAQLPVTETEKDTSPIGAVLDLSATKKVPKPIPGDEMDESQTPLPALLVLNNEGVLASWWVVYSESVRQGTTYPGLVATGGAQPGATTQAISADKQLSPIPSFPQPVFGSSSNVGSAFGSVNKPTPAFSTGSTFIGQSNKHEGLLGTSSGLVTTTGTNLGVSSFGSATPAFGTTSFGNQTSPTTAGVAFGNSALPGSRPSPWGVAGAGAQSSTFGQPSSLGVGTLQGLGSTKPSNSVFGSGPSSIVPVKSGFASFANKGGFATASTPQKENIFATKSDSAGFSSSSNVAVNTFDSSHKIGAPPAQTGNPLGSQGFTLRSSFTPDTSVKVEGRGIGDMESIPFFGTGFGKALGDAQMSPEATMDDDTMDPREVSISPKMNAFKSIISPTEKSQGQLPGATTTISTPQFQFPTAPMKNSIFGSPAPKAVNTNLPNRRATNATSFKLQAPLTITRSEDNAEDVSPPLSLPVDGTSQDANATPKLQSFDGIRDNFTAITKDRTEDSIILPKNNSQTKGGSVLPKERHIAPLPPDFLVASKSSETESLHLDSQDTKGSSFRADLIPPLDVPPGSEDGHSPDYSDEGDQSYSDEEVKNGEDIAKYTSIASGITPKLDLERSFDRSKSNYDGRGNITFSVSSMGGHQSSSRSLFGEVGNQTTPILLPPKPGSPRSPSPVRSSVPSRLLSRPDVSRSVSAPIAASKLLGAHPASISNNTPGHSRRYIEEDKLRTEASKKKDAEESQALVDMEDDMMQDFLSKVVEGTTRLSEFVAHQDYVGGADKDSIPFQVEAVYRDINSMIDTLGVNSHTVIGFTKGHSDLYKDSVRERADLEGGEKWCLGEIENLSSIIEKDLSKELQQGRIKDVSNKLQICSTFTKELAKLRTRTENALVLVTSSCDEDHTSIDRSQPLTTEQVTQQHDLRKDLAKFQRLLGDAEEELTLLRSKIASFTSSKGNTGPSPTTEAVMRTIIKMTAMAEKRSGDVDVIETQMRRLRFSSVASNGGNSPERSPFVSPSKLANRYNMNSTLSGRPYTPDGIQRGFRPLQASLSSSTRPLNQFTPPRKRMRGFTEEDKSTIKLSVVRTKEVTDKLRKALEMSHRVRPMDDE